MDLMAIGLIGSKLNELKSKNGANNIGLNEHLSLAGFYDDIINSWISWTPNITWGTATPIGVTTECYFKVIGSVLHVNVSITATDGNGTTSMRLDGLPAKIKQFSSTRTNFIRGCKKIGTGSSTATDFYVVMPTTEAPYFYIPNTVATGSSFIYTFSTTLEFQSTNYDSIALLKADTTLLNGDTASTNGYYEYGDNGGAVYTISNASLTDNGVTIHELDNGLFARLVYDSVSTNVAVGGIVPNEKIAVKLNTMMVSLLGKTSTLVFNNGEYLIEYPVYLKSFNYQGSDNTVLSVTSDFNRAGSDKVFTTHLNTDSTALGFYNLNFLFETSEGHTMQEYETIFIQLQNISYCNIEYCSIISKQAKTNGAVMYVDNLWFRNGDADNITISNTVIESISAEINDTTHIVGGCLWFWGNSNVYTISNVTISDCVFRSSATDEVVTIFQGTISDILFERCDFICESHNSDNILSVNQNDATNVVFSECRFMSDSPSVYPIKMSNYTADISMTDCDVEFNSGSTLSTEQYFALWLRTSELSPLATLAEKLAQNIYTISGCSFISSNGSKYNGFLLASDATINMYNNTIDGDYQTGFVWIESACVIMDVDGNTIDTGINGNFIRFKDLDSTLTNIEISNNTIVQNVNNIMSGAIAATLNMHDNIIQTNSNGVFYYDNNSTIDEDNSSFIFNNNHVYSADKFDLYYSVTSQPQSSIIVESNTIYGE